MKMKKVLLILLVLFLLYWLFQNPAGLADSAQSLFGTIWDLLVDLFEAMMDFFGSL